MLITRYFYRIQIGYLHTKNRKNPHREGISVNTGISTGNNPSIDNRGGLVDNIQRIEIYGELERELQDFMQRTLDAGKELPFNTEGRINTAKSLMGIEHLREGAINILKVLKEDFEKIHR